MTRSGPDSTRTHLASVIRRTTVQRAGALLVVVLVISGAWVARDYLPSTEVVTYPGLFALTLFGSGSLVLPLPGIAAICASTSVLGMNPVMVGLTAAAGETLGESTGYLTGFGGRALIERHRLYLVIRRWMDRHGTLVLFLVAAIPNPIIDLVGVAAGSVGYPFRNFFLVMGVGKTVKGIGIAYACYFGYQGVLTFLT